MLVAIANRPLDDYNIIRTNDPFSFNIEGRNQRHKDDYFHAASIDLADFQLRIGFPPQSMFIYGSLGFFLLIALACLYNHDYTELAILTPFLLVFSSLYFLSSHFGRKKLIKWLKKELGLS